MENKENKIEETISQEEKPKNEGKKRKLIILICAILLVIGGFYAWNASLYQSTDDAYIEAHMIQIAPKVSGEVIETYITDTNKSKKVIWLQK